MYYYLFYPFKILIASKFLLLLFIYLFIIIYHYLFIIIYYYYYLFIIIYYYYLFIFIYYIYLFFSTLTTEQIRNVAKKCDLADKYTKRAYFRSARQVTINEIS